jgi:hypothetical protein
MYKVRRKNCEKIAAPEKSAAAFDPDSVRSRKIRSGSSGAGERSSMTMKAPMSAAAQESRPTVVPVAQPCWLARVSA